MSAIDGDGVAVVVDGDGDSDRHLVVVVDDSGWRLGWLGGCRRLAVGGGGWWRWLAIGVVVVGDRW